MRRLCSLLLVLFAGAVGVSCSPARTPCDETVGADVCSMTPEHYTCECEGRVEPARSDEQFPCGRVKTVCVGHVLKRQVPAGDPFAPQLFQIRDAGAGD